MSIRSNSESRRLRALEPRSWFALAVPLVSLSIGACGSTGSGSHASSTTLASKSTVTTSPSSFAPAKADTKADRDRDNDFSSYDDVNHDEILDYAKAANATNKRKITALVKRYYLAAAAEDGSRACSMLFRPVAKAVPEDQGTSPPGPAYMQGKTCPAVVTLMFKHFHDQIMTELPALKVTRVRLEHDHGLVVLTFGAMPERQTSVHREGYSWKMSALIDSEMP